MKRAVFTLVGMVCFFGYTALGPPVVTGQDLKMVKKVDIPGPKYKPGEVMVRFRPGVPGKAKAAAHGAEELVSFTQSNTKWPVMICHLARGW
jgi:hypothetical protein